MAVLPDADIEMLLGSVLRDGIRRLSLREQIASSLADLIAAGLLREGDELPSERELAATLEVSRDSVRGALQLLAERGILDIGHGTRTKVRQSPHATRSPRCWQALAACRKRGHEEEAGSWILSWSTAC